MSEPKPLALADPEPRTLEAIFHREELAELRRIVELSPDDGRKPTSREVDDILPRATFVIGQTDLPAGRLAAAPKLRAIFNVEGNFQPNVDYEECFRRGIHVLNVSPVFAVPVAEMGLGLCLDLLRGITDAHNAFTAGAEKYGHAGNQHALLLSKQEVGIIGFGALGRALLGLLQPFRCRVRVHDPWQPERLIEQAGCLPSELEELLGASKVVFVTAAVTTENQGFLGERQFRVMRPGSLFILLSRAGVVDFPAFLAAAASGHIRAATDVFPEEPLAPDHPARRTPNLLLSAHRAGGLDAAMREMGSLVLSDVRQILRGLPPSSCARAERETVARMRSKPVSRT